jgi:hypothetical protein
MCELNRSYSDDEVTRSLKVFPERYLPQLAQNIVPRATREYSRADTENSKVRSSLENKASQRVRMRVWITRSARIVVARCKFARAPCKELLVARCA